MKTIHGLLLKAAIAATALTAFSAPALARDRHDDRGWHEHRDRHRGDWNDRRYRNDGDVRLRGPGVSDLHPWFRNAKSGRQFAARRVGTRVTDRDAWRLNREYCDRFGRGEGFCRQY